MKDQALKDDALMQDSISSGIELAPLKNEVPIPVGIRVGHVQHSEYGGGSVESYEKQTAQSNAQADLLLEASQSSGIELAPLKPEVALPTGIKIAHVKHSEYGGNQSDPEEKEKVLDP